MCSSDLEALAAFDLARNASPDDAIVNHHRGFTLYILGRTAEALASLDRSVAVAPDRVASHFDRALCLLRLGRWTEGWEEYEWRKRSPLAPGTLPAARPELQPGMAIAGKHLLIHAEQGLGDTLQLARYAKVAIRAGARVTLSVPRVMQRIMRTIDTTLEVTSFPLSVPCDLACATFSMPRVFGLEIGRAHV